MAVDVLTATIERFRADPAGREVGAGGHRDARQRACPAVGRGVQLGRGPARPRSAARTSRRARPPTSWARSPAAAWRSSTTPSRPSSASASTRSPPSRAARSDLRGLLGIDGASAGARRDRARHRGRVARPRVEDRADARRVARALPDLPRAPPAQRGRAHDPRRGGRGDLISRPSPSVRLVPAPNAGRSLQRFPNAQRSDLRLPNAGRSTWRLTDPNLGRCPPQGTRDVQGEVGRGTTARNDGEERRRGNERGQPGLTATLCYRYRHVTDNRRER